MWNQFKPSSKIFYWLFQGSTFLWIICVIYVLCLSCFRDCSLLPCGYLKGNGWPLGSCLWCLLWFCYFPFGILGHVWYLIVLIPDPCCLTYFQHFSPGRDTLPAASFLFNETILIDWKLLNRYFCKQCRSRWNAAECSISSGSAQFAKIKSIMREGHALF